MAIYLRGIIVSFVAAACYASAQDLSKKVSLEIAAAPTSKVVAELAKASGVQLEVSPAQDRDILIIRVKDVELKEVMDQIAVATTGEWKQDGELWRLSRDAVKQTAEERKEFQERVAEVKKAISELREHYFPKPKPKGEKAKGEGQGEPSQPAQVTTGFNPYGTNDEAGKAIVNMLTRVDPTLIAGIDSDGRLVFSSAPTRMQRSLSADWDAVNRMIAEHNKQAAERKATKDLEEGAQTPEQAQMREYMEKFMPGFANRDEAISTAPAKMLMIVTRGNSFFTGATVTMAVYDARGKVILEHVIPLDIGQGLIESVGDVAVGPDGQIISKKPPTPADDSPTIKLSPIAEEMMTMFSRYYGPGADEPKLSAALAERLQRPDVYDPLSYDVSESIFAVASWKKVNVVANVPDAMAGGFFRFGTDNEKKTTAGYLKLLKSGDDTEAIESPGWLIVRPATPADARKKRVSRTALTKLIASSAGSDVPTLDAMAAYSLEAESPQSTPVVMPYMANFAANVIQGGMMGLLNWDALRLYATLSAPQKQVVSTGGRIPFSALTPVQTPHVYKIIFGASARLKVDRPGDKPSEEFGWEDMMRLSSMMGGVGTDFRQEPTEVMANGLPGNGYLDLKITNENFALVVGEKGGTVKQYGALGTDELAILRYFTEDPNFQQVAAQIPKFEKFRVGDRTSYDFKFHLAPDVHIDHTLRDDRIQKDSPVVTTDNLPSGFRSRIERRLASLKKNPFPFPMGLGQAVPPP